MSSFRKLLVVIPTRNRASLAVTAARSVLTSSLDDVQVVISDNSTLPEASEELLAACGSLELTYWRPPAPLRMDAHWDWAARRASADPSASHVTFLTDRMVVRRQALAGLLRVVRRSPNDVVSYGHDRLDDLRLPVRLERNQWTGRVVRLPSTLSAQLVSEADETVNLTLPRLLNCAVPVQAFRAVEVAFGSVCGGSISPDFAFAFRCLATLPSILFYDRSVLTHYAVDRSNGASVARGVASVDHVDFIGGLGAESLILDAPIPDLLTVHNAVIHEYRTVMRRRGTWPPVALRPYLEVLSKEVEAMEAGPMKRRALGAMHMVEHGDPALSALATPSRSKRMLVLLKHPPAGMNRLLVSTRKLRRIWKLVERLGGVTAPRWDPVVATWPTIATGLERAMADDHLPHAGVSAIELSAFRRGAGSVIEHVATVRS